MADAPAHHLLVLLGAQFYVAETRGFLGTAVHVLNSLQSRLPPIDVDSEQADLPEVLVAIQRLGSCKVSL